MPSILSKIFAGSLSHDLSCHETYHTWTKSCSEAADGLFLSFFQESFKVYILLYIVNQVLLKRKIALRDFVTSFENASRSSFFMGFTPFMTMTLYCWLRKSNDKFYYWLQLYVPQTVACFFGIQVESPSRRETLTVFSTNLASEILYRLLQEKTGLKSIPGGSMLLFASSVMMFIHSYERSKRMKDLTGNNSNIKDEEEYKKGFQALVMDFLQNRNEERDLCSHEHFTYNCLVNSLKAFAMTFGTTGLLQCLLNAFQANFSLTTNQVKRTTFFSTFVALFRLSNCFLHSERTPHQRNEETSRQRLSDSEISLLSGIMASTAMIIHSDNNIALYFFWKSFQFLLASYSSQSTRNIINLFLFVFSTSQVFHSLTIHQHLIRRGYISFIGRLSEGKIHEINRDSFEFFRKVNSK